ncbi:unnamed protein product [Rotaria sordida]|uniref:TRAF1-6 MATH domain-containing protein n=1 Tax=Rotaria sordida TaxID=392033 RepID=A0A814RCV6_9BILA|nr:unnamed protein product [Rotaria sordida]CAF1131478.1 unnamed protein product [Rotaria sordida]CAF1182843.1 unnamed protein product [Rotaria sordida]CAF1188225.1 unnamed protein product [Rotaria sordida]CAF1354730.1 unnamed protein product [Rotaria sordida]
MSDHYMTEQHQNAIIAVIRCLMFKSSSDHHDKSSEIEIDISSLSTTTMISPVNDNIDIQLQEVCETIDILAGGIQTLNDDAQRLSHESVKIQNAIDGLTQEFAVLKLSIQEQNVFLDGLKPNQEILQQDVSSLKQKRPRSEMNIASGIPKFFPLTMIEQDGNPYVRDDTMFIKIMVDFGDMPKTLLPYALGLNPGLPINIQQAMIKREAERRAQQAATVPNL